MGLLAVSFDVTFGFGGMLNLGQAMFFGLAAYVIGWLLLWNGADLAYAVPAAILTATLSATLVGFVAVRGSNHSLLILTLIFVTVSYTWAQNQRDLTGGDDGLILAGTSLRVFGHDILATGRYRFSMLSFSFVFALTVYLMWSPFGRVLRAIKENTLRADFLGYDTVLVRVAAFSLGGFIAGTAGVIYAISFQHVHTGQLHWTVSASALVWAFFGGLGTLAGPILGVLIIRPFEDLTAMWVGHPKFFTGFLLVVMVLMNRFGVLGLMLSGVDRFRASLGGKGREH
jgi:branched-chain amino acid transport system permease protein